MKSKKSKGTHTKLAIVTAAAILAVAISSTGIVYAQAVPIQPIITASGVQRLQSVSGGITDIDAPNSAVSGTMTVSGWALNASGISRVDMYAFDSAGSAHWLGSVSANALTARPDVKAAFPDYSTLNSGYSLSVDTTSFKAGTYTLGVAGIGKDGTVQWTTKTITIGPAPLTDIDAPSGEQDGSFTVSGWALDKSGINRVDVYAWDSTGVAHSLGSAPVASLTARQDVENAFPTFGTLDSGYSVTVADKTLGVGKYTLAVAGIGNDGDVQWATKSITVGPAPLTDIDTPDWTRVTDGKLPVSGWALNKTGISRVDMYALDNSGHYHSLGSVGSDKLTARQDVESAFPSFDTLNSGYSLTADVSSLSAGSYTLCVAGIGNDGSVQWATKQFSIPGTTTAAPITDIDTPSQTYTGVIPVSGWALNSSGISRVDVYAYDSNGTPHSLGSVSANALSARQDVQNAYPSYGILNSGYSLSIPAGTLSAGNYTLAVAGIGNDGSVQWATQGVTVAQVANYQGTNVTKTYTDEITGIQQTVHFQGVGAGYCEVAGGYADINTTAEMGMAHKGPATFSVIGPAQQSTPNVVAGDGQNGGAVFSNLTTGAYTFQLTAGDGTVVARYHFTVDAHGNVE
ncbi:hypothetical protein [Ethanoligenens sp.]|uniref:hypothetical protein n=1 Tax=Ethanoligenens sp. TaxID=2099655 RepID=UPI0039E8A9D5